MPGLQLLACWITAVKSLSPDSAWTLPVCLKTGNCQSLSLTHTYTKAFCSPIEAQLSVQIREVCLLRWYCQMQDSTVPSISPDLHYISVHYTVNYSLALCEASGDIHTQKQNLTLKDNVVNF